METSNAFLEYYDADLHTPTTFPCGHRLIKTELYKQPKHELSYLFKIVVLHNSYIEFAGVFYVPYEATAQVVL